LVEFALHLGFKNTADGWDNLSLDELFISFLPPEYGEVKVIPRCWDIFIKDIKKRHVDVLPLLVDCPGPASL